MRSPTSADWRTIQESELYDLQIDIAQPGNLSVRANVRTGDNIVMAQAKRAALSSAVSVPSGANTAPAWAWPRFKSSTTNLL